MKATVTDLRLRLKDVLAALDRGEPVTLTYRGKDRAQIKPVQNVRPDWEERLRKMQAHPAIGMWANREDMKDPTAYIMKMRESRYDASGFRRDDLGVPQRASGSAGAGKGRKANDVRGDADGSNARRRVRR
ncbi:MAG: hypothetical protein NTZ56_09050 [Acidobacteria bacterium]|nr:hypothetical protein [Acidobacteriota bacterium]